MFQINKLQYFKPINLVVKVKGWLIEKIMIIKKIVWNSLIIMSAYVVMQIINVTASWILLITHVRNNLIYIYDITVSNIKLRGNACALT